MTEELLVETVDGPVSALANVPDGAAACLVLAHGAGAGMRHPFMLAVADGLAARRVATFRYQFPYMERGGKRPDRPATTSACVRAAVAEAGRFAPQLFAGGKSFGGRMTSTAQAEAPLPGIRGLVFFGFPLHPANKPSTTRAAHLESISVPMLFLQGARDTLASAELISETTQRLGSLATLATSPHADHSFHIPKRSGGSDRDVMDALLDTTAAWIARIVAGA